MNPPTTPTINPQTQSLLDSYKSANPSPTPSSSVGGGTSNWYSQLKAGAYRPAGMPTPQTTAPAPETGGFPEVGSDLESDAKTYAGEINQTNSSNENVPSKALQDVGSGAKLIGNAAVDLVKPAIKPQVTQAVGDKLEPLIESAKQSPAGQAVLNWWADLEQSHPEAAKNLEATGNIASLLSNAAGAGAAKEGVEVGTDAALSASKDAIAPATDAAKGAIDSIKSTASDAKDAASGVGKKSFQDVYNAHAQSSKALSNAVKANTIVKDGETITPIYTMEKYEATPKVASNTKGGHVLDMSDVQTEATANSKAASKTVDAKVGAMEGDIDKKQVLNNALDAASKDKEITRTASVPGVQRNIKQIFEDYGIEGDKMTPKQVNEFRKGANTSSQAYYNAQKVAATAGSIPKDVADRAQAFAVLGDTFRDTLTDIDPTIDADLTTQRLHNAVQQYAAKANRSPIGLSGTARTMVDVGGAGAGAAAGSIFGPGGAAVGAGMGAGLSEKAQAMLLRRLYEGAVKH